MTSGWSMKLMMRPSSFLRVRFPHHDPEFIERSGVSLSTHLSRAFGTRGGLFHKLFG